MNSGERVLVGLEHVEAADYAMRLNLAAQINLVNGALPRMSVGGRIVFVTSHLAHFYGTGSFAAGIPRWHANLNPTCQG
jgi:NAD(P)-dependent dehydrogenase (short-subunit alcohol dehydrogenase family)